MKIADNLAVALTLVALLPSARAQSRLLETCGYVSFGRAVSESGVSGAEASVLIGHPCEVYNGSLGLVKTPWGDVTGEQVDALFGESVLGAQDISGAASLDFVVGAPEFDSVGPGSGRVYVYEGGTTTLLYTLDGSNAGDRFGSELAGIGDLDGDSRSDFLVAATQVTSGGPGYVRVISGSSGSVIREHSASEPASGFGQGLAGLADLDGDGVRDYAIGAPGEDASVQDCGRVRIYSGALGSLLATLDGTQVGQGFGFAIASDFDANRDGLSDLAVGSPFPVEVPPGSQRPGYVSVFLSPGLGQFSEIQGAYANDWFGCVLSGVDDFDGDGFGDIAIGAPGIDSRVCYASPFRPGYADVRSALDGTIHARVGSSNEYSGLGLSLHTLSDQDGDDLSEVVVGGQENIHNYGGSCVLIIGRQQGGTPVYGAPDTASYGQRVAALGDVTGDGIPDLGIVAPAAGLCQVLSGDGLDVVYELAGDSIGRGGDFDLDGLQDFVVGGPQARAISGSTGLELFTVPVAAYAIDGGKDVDGDGVDDFIAGGAASTTASGSVHLVSGGSGTILHSYSGLLGLGFSVSLIDDLNGDGHADFLYGVPGEPDDVALNSDGGYVDIRSGMSGQLLHQAKGRPEDQKGTAVVDVGDVNGDGSPDYAYSSWSTDCQAWCFGTVVVASGADHSVLWDRERGIPYGGPTWGYALDSIADWNDNGVPDLVVSMPGRTSQTCDGLGTVYVLEGSTGADEFSISGYGGWDYFGYSLAVVEDLNGDGSPEIFVGAPGDSNPPGGGQSSWGHGTVLYSNHLDARSHCLLSRDSTGRVATLSAWGSGSIAANQLRLRAADVLPNTPLLFVMGSGGTATPFGDSYLCLSQPGIFRLNPVGSAETDGSASRQVDLQTAPASVVTPGSRWSFQLWYRDPSGPSGFNLSDALSLRFHP